LRSLFPSTSDTKKSDKFIFHRALSITVKKLLTMLAEDAAMVIERSGSWEASNMAAVLQSHGYCIQ
jgi:hypothetical protein